MCKHYYDNIYRVANVFESLFGNVLLKLKISEIILKVNIIFTSNFVNTLCSQITNERIMNFLIYVFFDLKFCITRLRWQLKYINCNYNI